MTRKLVGALALGLLLWPADAHAYLDPATGSMVMQVAVGGFLAAVAALKMYWARIRAAFRRPRKETPVTQEGEAD